MQCVFMLTVVMLCVVVPFQTILIFVEMGPLRMLHSKNLPRTNTLAYFHLRFQRIFSTSACPKSNWSQAEVSVCKTSKQIWGEWKRSIYTCDFTVRFHSLMQFGQE